MQYSSVEYLRIKANLCDAGTCKHSHAASSLSCIPCSALGSGGFSHASSSSSSLSLSLLSLSLLSLISLSLSLCFSLALSPASFLLSFSLELMRREREGERSTASTTPPLSPHPPPIPMRVPGFLLPAPGEGGSNVTLPEAPGELELPPCRSVWETVRLWVKERESECWERVSSSSSSALSRPMRSSDSTTSWSSSSLSSSLFLKMLEKPFFESFDVLPLLSVRCTALLPRGLLLRTRRGWAIELFSLARILSELSLVASTNTCSATFRYASKFLSMSPSSLRRLLGSGGMERGLWGLGEAWGGWERGAVGEEEVLEPGDPVPLCSSRFLRR
mmetsp:Transcript_22040/g.48994  ORF Transcript_22040/g.48994 Transcript_22040/m.48994 type:complete len:332 (-) Transcript_22040:565-1560(-)